MSKEEIGLKCVECGYEHNANEVNYLCRRCGGNLDVVLNLDHAAERVNKETFENRGQGLERYLEFLPVKQPFITLFEGGTPLLRCERLAERFKLKNLYVKDETRNPTGVFKDRATAVATTKVMELGLKTVAIASTGNAAASQASYSAKAGLECFVCIPASIPIGKLTQSIAYGAKILPVKGTYDQAFDIILEACERFGWYNCSLGVNPFRIEGKKTISYEICEQLYYDPPDELMIPMGNGCLLAGLWKGWKEFSELGFVNGAPVMVGIQAEGSAPLVKASKEGKIKVEPVLPNMVADGIAVGNPRNATKALRALKESHGIAETVSDKEILDAQKTLAKLEGVFAEPAGAAPIAGLKKLIDEGRIGRNDVVVCVVTGTGLKNPAASLKHYKIPQSIEPRISAVEQALKRMKK